MRDDGQCRYRVRGCPVRRVVLAYCAGVLSVLGLAYHAGSDTIIQCGLKLAAMQTTFAYDARPVLDVDEQTMVAELARPVPAKKGRK